MTRIFTLGFTRKSARQFFEFLAGSGARRLLDVRLNNTSQLAGFTKQDDLAYFLERILGMDYHHLPELAPTKAILGAYREDGDWARYAAAFNKLLEERRVAERLEPTLLDDACLLCSEATPEHCHRRLVAEHLAGRWGTVEIVHL
jgi:uncharacterized protein (DUF488 family)